jgi:hypothetical protein
MFLKIQAKHQAGNWVKNKGPITDCTKKERHRLCLRIQELESLGF